MKKTDDTRQGKFFKFLIYFLLLFYFGICVIFQILLHVNHPDHVQERDEVFLHFAIKCDVQTLASEMVLNVV